MLVNHPAYDLQGVPRLEGRHSDEAVWFKGIDRSGAMDLPCYPEVFLRNSTEIRVRKKFLCKV